MILLIQKRTCHQSGDRDRRSGRHSRRGWKSRKNGKNIKAKADRVIDAKGCYVMPGFIDMHVHLRDPGTGAERDDRDRL